MSRYFSFSLKLFVAFAILFPIHSLTQEKAGYGYFEHLITESYLANYSLVLLSFFALLYLQKRFASSLGFLFLGGFFIKLIVFFIFFSPYYKSDDQIETAEFLAFFVPYALALTLETISLVRILNKA